MKRFACMILGLAGTLISTASANDREPLKLDPRYFGQLGAGVPQRYHKDVDDLLGKGNLEHVWPYRTGRVREIANATGFLDFLTASEKRYSCTGALVSDRLLLTAAHCVDLSGPDRATQVLFYLGYERVIDKGRINPLAVKPRPVEHDIDLDYALLELYTPASGKMPVRGRVRDAKAGTGLTILAHPKASPLLLAQKNCLPHAERPLQGIHLNHNCHTEIGSSGALVFSRDGRSIVGLHVEGDVGVNRAVRMTSLLEASSRLRELFGVEDSLPTPVVRLACPPASSLPEGLRCEVGSGGELVWEKTVSTIQSPQQPFVSGSNPVKPFSIAPPTEPAFPSAEIDVLVQSAMAGDAISMMNLCQRYYRGIGVQADRRLATEWCRSAFNSGRYGFGMSKDSSRKKMYTDLFGEID